MVLVREARPADKDSGDASSSLAAFGSEVGRGEVASPAREVALTAADPESWRSTGVPWRRPRHGTRPFAGASAIDNLAGPHTSPAGSGQVDGTGARASACGCRGSARPRHPRYLSHLVNRTVSEGDTYMKAEVDRYTSTAVVEKSVSVRSSAVYQSSRGPGQRPLLLAARD